MSLTSNLSKTIELLQEFIDSTQLGLKVDALCEDDFESLSRDERSILNWRDKFPHYLSESSFHLGVRLDDESKIDGAMLGIYASENGELHILLIESFVRNNPHHPLSGRLTMFVIVATMFFLSQYSDSKGVYIIEPHPELISYYEKFGFKLLENELVMYATVEELQLAQLNLFRENIEEQ